MKPVIATFIFCFILFIYLHVYFHLKTSNDLEVYEIDQPSKEKLEEICDLRQPVILDFLNERLLESCSLSTISQNYGAFDVKIRNVLEFDDETEMFMPITLNAAKDIFSNDSKQSFLSENNSDFLEETGVIKTYKYNDSFLRPYMVSKCIYDLMFASNNTETPLRYECNYRNFFLVTEGKVKIKLIPPHSNKYLYGIEDYDNFEFRSPVNPWNVQFEYKPDFDKIKTMDVELKKGQIIFIPSYWWYSIKFEINSTIAVFKYLTYMNVISIIPKLFRKMLQNQNVKREIAKKKQMIISNSNENDKPNIESEIKETN